MFMAAENSVVCLLGAMDRLWFHHIILFSEFENPKTSMLTLESSDILSKQSSQLSGISEQEISSVGEDETNSQETRHEGEREKKSNPCSRKSRFHSSSQISVKKQSRNYSSRKLEKSMSCKTLKELELEEVKGFMDLGFIFKKESLSKHMMRIIPGLQRLDSDKEKDSGVGFEYEEDEGVMRPYLSEAWSIKRPDSPLLKLRVARASTDEDMKRHLKYWARIVASAIQQ